MNAIEVGILANWGLKAHLENFSGPLPSRLLTADMTASFVVFVVAFVVL